MRDNFYERSYVDKRGKNRRNTVVIVVHCERFLTRDFRASAVWMKNEKEIKKIRNKKYVYIYTNTHAHTRIPVYTSKMWKPFSNVINLLKAPPPPILLSTRSSMRIVKWLYEKSKVKVSLQLRQLFRSPNETRLRFMPAAESLRLSRYLCTVHGISVAKVNGQRVCSTLSLCSSTGHCK